MERTQFLKEYPLKKVSRTALWKLISMPNGLAEWFCDNVEVEQDVYTFTWKGNQQAAKLLAKYPEESIKFQWEEDYGTKHFFEMSIIHSELTGMVELVINDTVDDDDIDASTVLWDSMIDRLKRKLGLN